MKISDIVDEIVSKYSLPSVNENSIASFVKLRNNKTHSGTVEWGESAKIYTPLFAIVYASFFKYIKLPDEVIKSTLLQIFLGVKHKKIFRRSAVLYNALYIKPLMMHTPIRSLPLRADYDLTTVYGSALHYLQKV